MKYILKFKDIYLEELNLKKLKKEDGSLELFEDKSADKSTTSIDLSGTLMYDEENINCLKYIFGVEIVIRNKFKISLIYDSYFILKEFAKGEIDDDELVDEFNYYIWPYVIEQIENISSRINLKGKVRLPTYEVISNESKSK